MLKHGSVKFANAEGTQQAESGPAREGRAEWAAPMVTANGGVIVFNIKPSESVQVQRRSCGADISHITYFCIGLINCYAGSGSVYVMTSHTYYGVVRTKYVHALHWLGTIVVVGARYVRT